MLRLPLEAKTAASRIPRGDAVTCRLSNSRDRCIGMAARASFRAAIPVLAIDPGANALFTISANSVDRENYTCNVRVLF
jgi:hypothetical protein